MALRFKITLILTILALCSSKRPFDLIFEELKCQHYGEPIKEFMCNKYEKGNNSYIRGRMVFSSQVNAFEIRGVAEIPRSGGEPITLFNINLDGCKLLESKESDNILKLALQFMRKAGNIPNKCPLIANENLTLDGLLVDPDILPTYTPELSFLVTVDLLIKNKLACKAFMNGRVEMKKKQKRFFKI